VVKVAAIGVVLAGLGWAGAAQALAIPATEVQTMTLACQVATAYLGYVNKQDVQALQNLFVEGVNYTGPDGTQKSNPADIAAGYAQGFKNMGTPWQFKLANAVPFGDDGCLLEFGFDDPKNNAITLSAVDRFRVNPQGKVTQFLPYFASDHIQKVMANISKHKTDAKKQ
jgi:hypothetical protein